MSDETASGSGSGGPGEEFASVVEQLLEAMSEARATDTDVEAQLERLAVGAEMVDERLADAMAVLADVERNIDHAGVDELRTLLRGLIKTCRVFIRSSSETNRVLVEVIVKSYRVGNDR
jgi:hypothetical protein